ncbi:MAG: type II toxin-antitoxin system HicA family toxin [Nitrospiraceae bacterium]|nr:type II toxin-antitoxin system HicA family toxin [Nitrospiraceae bacterium]
MSKELPSLTPKHLIRVLEKIGFEFFRQKGSHRVFVKGDRQVIVPYHSKDLKKGTLYQIIKGTGLSIEEFIRFL